MGSGKFQNITMKEAQGLGFKYLSENLYSSRLKWNTALVEEGLQKALQHHPLGIRLWRYPGMGPKVEDQKSKKRT